MSSKEYSYEVWKSIVQDMVRGIDYEWWDGTFHLANPGENQLLTEYVNRWNSEIDPNQEKQEV